MSTFKCHKAFCHQVTNYLLLKSILELCRRNDPRQGLLALGNPLRALLQQGHTGSAGNSKVRIENKLCSIRDMLSPTLGRPPALPWWPDQPHPAGPTPSHVQQLLDYQQLCHSPCSCRAGARRPPTPPSSCRPEASEQDGMSKNLSIANFEHYYSCSEVVEVMHLPPEVGSVPVGVLVEASSPSQVASPTVLAHSLTPSLFILMQECWRKSPFSNHSPQRSLLKLVPQCASCDSELPLHTMCTAFRSALSTSNLVYSVQSMHG